MKKPLDRETALRLLDYEAGTGTLTWKVRRGKGHPGEQAGTICTNGLYRQIGVCRRVYLEHHIIWLLMTGEFPPNGMQIDHKNRNGLDNSWPNLRLASPTQNSMNIGVDSRSGLGVKGVRFTKNGFEAHIGLGGKFTYLGRFKTVEEASSAYMAAELAAHPEFATAGN